MTKEEIVAKEEKEKTYLFYKSMQCPICDGAVKWRTIKSGRLRIEGQEPDLRQLYYGVDANKYHVVSCPHCGYTALERYFTEKFNSLCIKNIKEHLPNINKVEEDPEIITYRQAFARYHMALQCASAKKQSARASEIAYICLKTAWLLRGEREELIAMGQEDKGNALLPVEERFLKNAYDQFIKAKMQEDFPMCGMDSATLDYLIAALAMGLGEYDTASKVLSSVITSFSASAHIKDKARGLKEKLQEQKGE